MSMTRSQPVWLRLFHMIPIVGWMARDTDRHGEDNLVWGLLTIPMAWAISALLFGYPGIIVPALLLVPAIFLYLLVVTWG